MRLINAYGEPPRPLTEAERADERVLAAASRHDDWHPGESYEDDLLVAREMLEAADRAVPIETAYLLAEIEDWERSFALYDDACRRGTVLWRAAGQGRDEILPDTAKLVAWLLAERDRLRAWQQEAEHTLFEAGKAHATLHLRCGRLRAALAPFAATYAEQQSGRLPSVELGPAFKVAAEALTEGAP